jgi:hypothetical protein
MTQLGLFVHREHGARKAVLHLFNANWEHMDPARAARLLQVACHVMVAAFVHSVDFQLLQVCVMLGTTVLPTLSLLLLLTPHRVEDCALLVPIAQQGHSTLHTVLMAQRGQPLVNQSVPLVQQVITVTMMVQL